MTTSAAAAETVPGPGVGGAVRRWWRCDPAGGARAQTADVLRQVDALLREAGPDMRALLSVTVVLADIRDAPAMNRAWDRWLDPAAKPARMTIQAPLVDPAWKVEITGTAALPPA